MHFSNTRGEFNDNVISNQSSLGVMNLSKSKITNEMAYRRKRSIILI